MMTMAKSKRLPPRRCVSATSARRHVNKPTTPFSRRLCFSLPSNRTSSNSSSVLLKQSSVEEAGLRLLQNHSKHHGSVRPYVSSSTTMPEKLQDAMQTVRQAAKQQDTAAKTGGGFWQRVFQWYSRKLSTHPLITKSLTSAIIAGLGDVLCQATMHTSPPPTPTTHSNENEEEKSKDGKDGMIESGGNSSINSINMWVHSFWTTGWDAQCTCIFALLGFTFVAPTSHFWYDCLARHPWTLGQSLTRISKRVFLDQFIWTPVFFVIWLISFWSLQDIAATAAAANSATAADTNKSDTTPATETETTSTMSKSAQKISSQLAHQLPEVMIANWILWIPAQYINFYACPVKFQVLFCNVFELVWNAYLSFATRDVSGHEATPTTAGTTASTTATATATIGATTTNEDDKSDKPHETKIPPIFYSRRQTIQRQRTNIPPR